MNLRDRFFKCSSLLSAWPDLLELEALKQYPEHRKGVLGEWCDSLRNLDDEQLYAFQNGFELKNSESDSLNHLIGQIQAVTDFESLQMSPRCLPRKLLRKVSPKKKHEIDCLLAMTDKTIAIDAILDVGGGVGHLSSALAHERNLRSYCVDADKKLQKAGRERLKRWSSDVSERVEFINAVFTNKFEHASFDQYANRLVIGLHSCGELGTNIIKFAARKKCEGMILASCCYHKLNGAYNLSHEAKKSGVSFSENALHLASRCYRYETLAQFQNKIRLRKYRYALHLWEYDKGHREFTSIGNTKLSDYDCSFSDYVKKYSIVAHASDESINRFYESSAIQRIVYDIIFVDIIRAFFGRVIETYLVLDRALYLEERGFRARPIQAFDPRLSPRNLVICASRP